MCNHNTIRRYFLLNREVPTHVRLKKGQGGVPEECMLECEQITTLPKDLLSAKALGESYPRPSWGTSNEEFCDPLGSLSRNGTRIARSLVRVVRRFDQGLAKMEAQLHAELVGGVEWLIGFELLLGGHGIDRERRRFMIRRR
jgi:hypothetical protein